MERYDVGELLDRRASSGRPYLEFQRSSDLSSGLYVLPAGGVDAQRPHGEDEIYEGRGGMTVGGETGAVGPGAVIFVGAGVPHRFHDIESELRLLVVFGPAEGSRNG